MWPPPVGRVPKTTRSGPCPDTPRVKTKTPGAGRGWCWLPGELKAAGVMPDPVGGGVRAKGFDAAPFETVPQLVGVPGGDDHAAGHDPYF